jgi:hypothetical protein
MNSPRRQSVPTIFTIGQVARRFGVKPWQVRRVFERGLLPAAARVGPYRVMTPEELPAVEAALIAAGYLPRREAASAT